jgi:hypothetical protein
MFLKAPDPSSGACADPQTQPVYRVWNRRPGHQPPLHDQRGGARPDGRGGRHGRGLRAGRRGDVRAEVAQTRLTAGGLPESADDPPRISRRTPWGTQASDGARRRRIRRARAVGDRGHQRRRDAVRDRPGRIARHPEKNTFELLPTTIAGEKINWIVLDDGSDTTKAVQNAKKLIGENKVDVLVGSTITPNSLAMVDIAAEAETPMLSMAASARIVDPANPKTRWVFKTPQSDALMADAIAVNMKANGVQTIGYIGFADAYGDGWLAEMKRSAQTAGIKVIAEEKYNRNDTSVTGQVLKLVAAKPDAILIGAAGTPGATPQKELVARGYKGKIYQTHGVANPDFLRVVGKDGEGTLLPSGRCWSTSSCPTATRSRRSRPSTSRLREEVRHALDLRRPCVRHVPAARATIPRR